MQGLKSFAGLRVQRLKSVTGSTLVCNYLPQRTGFAPKQAILIHTFHCSMQVGVRMSTHPTVPEPVVQHRQDRPLLQAIFPDFLLNAVAAFHAPGRINPLTSTAITLQAGTPRQTRHHAWALRRLPQVQATDLVPRDDFGQEFRFVWGVLIYIPLTKINVKARQGKRGHLQRVTKSVRTVLFTFVEARITLQQLLEGKLP